MAHQGIKQSWGDLLEPAQRLTGSGAGNFWLGMKPNVEGMAGAVWGVKTQPYGWGVGRFGLPARR